MVQKQWLSDKETWLAADQLHKEQLCLRKCGVYSGQIQDPQLRSNVQRLMDACQKHVSALEGIVGQQGGANM